MEIQVMKSVLAVSRYRSFQEAAHSLSISVSSISKHISAAEDELKCELFIRGTKCKSVMLTDAGVQLIPMIEEILYKHSVLERTADRIYNEKTRHLHIAYNSLLGTMGENAIVSNFCIKYPTVQVFQETATSPEMIRKLRAGVIDGCFMLFEVEAGEPLSNHPVFAELMNVGQFGHICFFRSTKMHIAISANHPLANRSSVRLEELQNETFIFNSGNRENYLTKHGKRTFQNYLTPSKQRYMDFTRHGIILETVAAGGGVVPTVSKDPDPRSGIRYPELEDWRCTFYGIFLYRRDVRSRAMLNFRKCIEDAAQSDKI